MGGRKPLLIQRALVPRDKQKFLAASKVQKAVKLNSILPRPEHGRAHMGLQITGMKLMIRGTELVIISAGYSDSRSGWG